MGKTGQTPAHDGCTTLPLTLQSAKHLQEQRSYHECDVSSTSFDSITFPEVRLSRHSGFRSFAIFPHVRPIRRGLASRASSVRHFTEAATGECRVEREPARHQGSTTARQGSVRQSVITPRRFNDSGYSVRQKLQRWRYSLEQCFAPVGASTCRAKCGETKCEMRNAKCECKRWPCRSQQPWKLPS